MWYLEEKNKAYIAILTAFQRQDCIVDPGKEINADHLRMEIS